MTERTNLIKKRNNGKYIWASLLFLLLSAGGVFWLMQGKNDKNEEISFEPIEISPTETISPTEAISPTGVKTTIAPTKKPTAIPTETVKVFESKDDNFKVSYSSYRQIYQDNENSGRRYTFYSYSGNIALHTGKEWSWTYPERVFTESLLVGGEKSFVYEADKQKIIDVEKDGKKYTIQCIHNNREDLIEECKNFMESFGFI